MDRTDIIMLSEISQTQKDKYLRFLSYVEGGEEKPNCHQEAVEKTIMVLQMNHDSNVKYFVSIHPDSTKISEDAISTASLTY
jgi:hypothetical protein